MQASQCRNVSGACCRAAVMECVRGVSSVATVFQPGQTSLSREFAAPQRRAAIAGTESRFVDRDERSWTTDAGCSSFVGRIVAALDWRLQCLHVRDDNALADTGAHRIGGIVILAGERIGALLAGHATGGCLTRLLTDRSQGPQVHGHGADRLGAVKMPRRRSRCLTGRCRTGGRRRRHGGVTPGSSARSGIEVGLDPTDQAQEA